MIYIEFDKPIPSLMVSKLIFKDEKWRYVYSFSGKLPGFTHNGLVSQEIVSTNKKDTVNIYIPSKKVLKELLEKQYKADKKNRTKYKELIKNNDILTLTIPNKTIKINAYITKIKRIRKNDTIFIGKKL